MGKAERFPRPHLQVNATSHMLYPGGGGLLGNVTHGRVVSREPLPAEHSLTLRENLLPENHQNTADGLRQAVMQNSDLTVEC